MTVQMFVKHCFIEFYRLIWRKRDGSNVCQTLCYWVLQIDLTLTWLFQLLAMHYFMELDTLVWKRITLRDQKLFLCLILFLFHCSFTTCVNHFYLKSFPVSENTGNYASNHAASNDINISGLLHQTNKLVWRFTIK